MNHQRWLSQNFFVFFLTWGIFLPYWTGWLVQAKGLSVSEASIMMGFGLLARGISTLFIFPLAFKYWSNQKILLFLSINSFLTLLFYIPSTSFTALFIVTLFFNAIYPSLLPAVDSTAGVLVQHGHVHYGKSRSYGSMGFVVSVLIISIVTVPFGDEAIFWSMLIGVLMILLIRFLPIPPILMQKPTGEDRKQALSIKNLWKIKGFPIVLIISILLQGAHASYYNYGYIYLQDIGVNGYYIGIILNIAIVFEVLYFLKADHMFKDWQPSSLLLLAAIGSTVRWLLVFLFPNVWVFILSQSLHVLSFAVAHYAFIQYITQTLPKQQIPNAQGLYSAFALSWSTAILTLAGGFLYEVSPELAFLGMVVCTFPAIILILLTRKRYTY